MTTDQTTLLSISLLSSADCYYEGQRFCSDLCF